MVYVDLSHEIVTTKKGPVVSFCLTDQIIF